MTIEDMAGGTFTISNGGIYGSLMGEFPVNLSHPSRHSDYQPATDGCAWFARHEGTASCR